MISRIKRFVGTTVMAWYIWMILKSNIVEMGYVTWFLTLNICFLALYVRIQIICNLFSALYQPLRVFDKLNEMCFQLGKEADLFANI